MKKYLLDRFKIKPYVVIGAGLVGLSSMFWTNSCNTIQENIFIETEEIDGVVWREYPKDRLTESDTSYRLVNSYEVFSKDEKIFICFTEANNDPFNAGDKVFLKVKDGEIKDNGYLKYGSIDAVIDGKYKKIQTRRIVSYKVKEQ